MKLYFSSRSSKSLIQHDITKINVAIVLLKLYPLGYINAIQTGKLVTTVFYGKDYLFYNREDIPNYISVYLKHVMVGRGGA